MTSHQRIIAPAKLNLFLHITGKRADGYHLLESLTLFTEFGDELEITPAPKLSLQISGNFAASLEQDDKDNLVLRAARLLQAEVGVTNGAAITLHKHIPVGAGLGGGSADAAAILLALENFWQVALTPQARHKIAVQLGSDVPACLLGHSGWVTGTGDGVSPISTPKDGWVLLVNPNTSLPTIDVFRLYQGGFSPSIPKPAGFGTLSALVQWAAAQNNALEAPACELLPVITQILSTLKNTPSCLFARMSGSGATCFGLYAKQSQAHTAAQIIQATHPNWWVQPTALKGIPHGQAQ